MTCVKVRAGAFSLKGYACSPCVAMARCTPTATTARTATYPEWRPDDFLDASGSMIQCAHHGALFLIENGECVTGPCAGRSLQTLSCYEDAEGIWINP